MRRPARRSAPRTRTPRRSSSSRPASCASQRSDGASAQWTSSTRSTVGARSARLAASHSSPCAAACIASPASAGSGASGSSTRRASPAAPTVSSLQSGPRCSGAKTGGRRPMPRPARAGRRAPAAPSCLRLGRCATAASRLDLPIPAAPSTMTRPAPARGAQPIGESGELGIAIQQHARMHRPYAGRVRAPPAGERSWSLPRCAAARASRGSPHDDEPPGSRCCRTRARSREPPGIDGKLVELVLAARAGDSSAWTKFLGRFDRTLRSIANSCRLGPADVDDVVQATWLDLFRDIERVREPAGIAGWLGTATRRKSMRLLRAALARAPHR